MSTPGIIQDIILCPDTGLVPFLEKTLKENWDRHSIKAWFPGSSIPRECGYRLRQARVQVQGVQGDLRLNTQEVILGRQFFVSDHNEGVIKAVELQNDIDDCVLHWRNFICPKLTGPMEALDGPIIGPIQNKDISGDRPHAWSMSVIREFSFSYYGDTRNEYCC